MATIRWNKSQAADNAARQLNAEAEAYLASTDWYAARALECGKPIPPDIAEARQAARGRIVKI